MLDGDRTRWKLKHATPGSAPACWRCSRRWWPPCCGSSDVGGRGDFNRYAIYFEQQALDGLEIGADVTLRGIKVGRVEDYALAGRQAQPRARRSCASTAARRCAPTRWRWSRATSSPASPPSRWSTASPPGELLTKVPEGERYPVIARGPLRPGGDRRPRQRGRRNGIERAEQPQPAARPPRTARRCMDTVRNLRDLTAGLNQRLAALDRTLERSGAAPPSARFGRRRRRPRSARPPAIAWPRVADRRPRRRDVDAHARRDRAHARPKRERALAQVAAASDALQRQAASTAQPARGRGDQRRRPAERARSPSCA